MLTIWWCPCIESSLVLLEKGVCYDQCVLLAELYKPLACFILYSKAKFACYSSGTPLQYSCLENPMDGGAWWAAVHGVTKSQTRFSDFTFTFHFPALEKEMATHSSVLAWRIPGTGEPRGLPSMESHRVGHDWSDLAAAAARCFLTSYFCIPVPYNEKDIVLGCYFQKVL